MPLLRLTVAVRPSAAAKMSQSSLGRVLPQVSAAPACDKLVMMVYLYESDSRLLPQVSDALLLRGLSP